VFEKQSDEEAYLYYTSNKQINTGCFFTAPPKLLKYGTCSPSTQKFSKAQTGPSSTPKYFYVQNRFSTKTTKDIAKFWYQGGASLRLSHVCVEGGQVPCSSNLGGGAVKKHSVVIGG